MFYLQSYSLLDGKTYRRKHLKKMAVQAGARSRLLLVQQEGKGIISPPDLSFFFLQ